MSLEKVSAERDALLHALKQAGEELARSRAALKQAEARLAESHAGRPPMIVPAKEVGSHAAIGQAQAAQQRAEATARSIGKQLHEQKAELVELRSTVAGLKGDNEKLRNQNEELLEQQDQHKQKAPDSPSPAQFKRDEVKWLRQELDTARSEIQRLRNLVVKVASESKRRGGSAESPLSPNADPKTGAISRPAPPTPSPAAPPKAAKADVDTTPRSGVHWAA